jgi:hypothetical protein
MDQPVMDEQNLATLQTQLALLLQKVDSLTQTEAQNHMEIKSMLTDHETRIRQLEKTSTEINAKMTMQNIIQSSFTAIASTLAAVVGKTS